MKHITAIILTLTLTACAGSKLQAQMWEQAGSLRVSEPDNASYDYKFYIDAGRDVGINTQNQEDRITIIRSYLTDACRDVQIVDEQFLPTGGTAIGGLKLGKYISHVKCIK